MRSWGEFWDFVRGTRPRPPPGAKRPLAMWLLVIASLLHLPAVYAFVRASDLAPLFTLVVGLVSIGLAWSGGVSLEGRRIGTARAFAAAAVAETALAFVPAVTEAAPGARWLFLAIGALGLVALLSLRRSG